MQIEANDVQKGMTIIDERDGEVIVGEVWPNRGDGLGVVIKGVLTNGELYFRRFLNPTQFVERLDRAV